MRKILCIILIISLLSCNICIYAEEGANNQEQETSEKNKTLEQLQNESNVLQEQINQTTERLEIVEEELTKNLTQVQEIDSKIQVSEEEVSKLNNEIEELNKNINQNQQELKKMQKQYDEVKQRADKALLAMYEGGDVQYIDVLLGSNSIFEFISNYFLIEELFSHNVSLVQEADIKKKEIEEIVNILDEKKEEITAKKKEKQRNSQILENTKTARQYYMSKLSEEEKQIQSEIDEYRFQMTEIETEIRRLSTSASFGEDYIGEEMIWPVPGYTRITSQYGMRIHPITGVYSSHSGTDVGAPLGTDFIAMATGVVTKAGYNKYYGNMVIIDHGGGVQTLYAHGSEIIVKLGDLVAQGTPVLKVGSTGYSTGPHAHFEIRINGKTVNPLDYVIPQ
jgi:murein DD-endopeptidase MepM/ murein hydrolase activator NlpD